MVAVDVPPEIASLLAILAQFPPTVSEPGSKLKTVEEYRLALHDKLLDARKDATDFVNLYVTFCYGLSGIILLYATGYIEKVSFGGADINLSKGYTIEYAAIVVLLAYVLTSFHVLRVSRIFRAIRRNGLDLNRLNPAAKVVNVEDMQLFVSGLLGLLLAIARAQTGVIMRHLVSLKPEIIFQKIVVYRSSPSIRNGLALVGGATVLLIKSSQMAPLLALRILFAGSVLYLPLISAVVTVVYVKYYGLRNSQPEGILSALLYYLHHLDPLDGVLLVGFVAVIALTFVASVVLTISYSRDMILKFLDPLNLSLNDLIGQLTSSDAQIVATAKAVLSEKLWQA